MKIRVLWFGRPTADPYREQVETFRARVLRQWPAEDVPLRSAAGGRRADPRRALASEADKVRAQLEQQWRVVALDEGGDRMSSERFAGWLAEQQEAGTPGLLFVVGSDLGLHADLQREAYRRLSLGPMTLPHQIARLVLWEQLFRATSILGGGGYHRHRVQ